MDQSSGPKYRFGGVSGPKNRVKVMCHVMPNHLKIVTVILTIIRARLPHTDLLMVDLHYILTLFNWDKEQLSGPKFRTKVQLSRPKYN